MRDFARLALAERTPYFQEAANRRGLTRLIVEKDFWVCYALGLLFATPELAGRLVFKGGTSLAKVFSITKRFSEDIDLSVDPGWLGFAGASGPDAARSRSQFEKRRKELNSACAVAVSDRIQPVLEQAICDELGSARNSSSYLAFSTDAQTQSPVLIFRYPTPEPDRPGYVLPQVKPELGSLTDQQPVGRHTITPWVAEDFPGLFNEPTGRVVALEVERTFWEKATILHAEYHRPADRPMRSRHSRDCYDVYEMAAHPAGQRALLDTGLLARVVCYKNTYFPSAWANYAAAKPGSLRLAPPGHRLPDLRADYQQMREMFTEPPPPFDGILQRLQQIEDSFNQG
jgi:hypothetical protein